MTDRAASELKALIGEEALILLAETFGGLRLLVPMKMGATHPIARAVGLDAAKLLSDRYAPDYLDVPLAREERALQYRADGRTIAEIARLLGISGSGVERLLARARRKQDEGSQLKLI